MSQEETALPLVELCDLPQEPRGGLIILLPTGVRWSNQAGGSLCDHPQAEGLFVPWPWPEETARNCIDLVADELEGEDFAARWMTRAELALAADNFPGQLDRDRWRESQEAWLFVRLHDVLPDLYGLPHPLRAFAGRSAILTWPNSD